MFIDKISGFDESDVKLMNYSMGKLEETAEHTITVPHLISSQVRLSR